MKKTVFTLIVLFLPCYYAFGQISTDEEPVSFRMNIPALTRSEKVQKIMPALDMKKIEQEDMEDETNGIPPRFGYKHKVSYNLENSGKWTDLPDESRIWRLSISCPGALSINLLYDKFWLPDGAKFFIYSNDRKHTIGAFTSLNNKGDRKNIQGFATGLVYANEIMLEYWLPKEVKETGIISVTYVVHGYRYILLPENEENAGYGQSMSCNINVNSPEGQNWQNEKNAVAMILVNGDRWCSGSLINTTANDNRPLFLTANHCLTGGSDAVTAPNLNHWSFYWHYESPVSVNVIPTIRETSGATLVANNDVSDFALLELSEDPRNKAGVTPYYLGWDRSGNAGTSGVGIHHPNGDIKKISLTNQIQNHPTTICWGMHCSQGISPANTHWEVLFSNGTTEGGSSGSPLINNNRKVIGQLHGGATGCAPVTKYYGRFDVSWTGNGTTDNRRRLQPWLDPFGINPTTLDGNGLITISGPTHVCSGSSKTFTATNWQTGFTWDKSSNLNITATNGSSVSVSAASGSSTSKLGWVAIRSGAVEVIRHQVWLGVPVVTQVGSTGSHFTYNHTYPFYAYIQNALAQPSYYYWVLNGNSGSISGNGTRIVNVTFFYTGNHTLYATASNSCGESTPAMMSILVDGWSPVSSYPNPASDILNIEIDTQAQSSAPAITSGTQLKMDKTYDLRLYDNQGTLLRNAKTKGGTVQFNVQNLPDGIYYLHIYDGVNPKPEMQQIVVEH